MATPPRSDSKMSIHEPLQTSAHLGNQEDLTHRPPPPKTQSYMDRLVPPSQENFERIAHIQEEKEEQTRQRERERRHRALHEAREQDKNEHHERTEAARLIQKTFRGHRARRELEGYGLDATTRWISALREAEYRETTRPVSKRGPNGLLSPEEEEQGTHRSNARKRWKKASIIARRAGHDDLESDSSSTSTVDTTASPAERQKIREESNKLLDGQRNRAQMMGLQYFLEMVDVKHRYGSNLRQYHAEWKKSDTKENFFYWLDFGSGKDLELDTCPRDRLEREKVRYLSREERQYYLVKVDDNGRLRWAKNDALIDTTVHYKDSIHGIVPSDDPTPSFNPETQPRAPSPITGSASSLSLSSIDSTRAADRAAKYASPDPDEPEPRGMRRVTHWSASTVWNKVLRRSVKDGTWIFVADTSFRLYVGIKNSGAFQHSSFLQGSRISAAGLIKIKAGRIRSLSPLSGHYRPPASNFRAFVKSLRAGGVDMHKVSISKSYAILVGLEAYVKTRKKSKSFFEKLMHRKDKVVYPEIAAQREEDKMDSSKSAQREREVIEQEALEREENKASVKMMNKLGLVPRTPAGQPEKEMEEEDKESKIQERMDLKDGHDSAERVAS